MRDSVPIGSQRKCVTVDYLPRNHFSTWFISISNPGDISRSDLEMTMFDKNTSTNLRINLVTSMVASNQVSSRAGVCDLVHREDEM